MHVVVALVWVTCPFSISFSSLDISTNIGLVLTSVAFEGGREELDMDRSFVAVSLQWWAVGWSVALSALVSLVKSSMVLASVAVAVASGSRCCRGRWPWWLLAVRPPEGGAGNTTREHSPIHHPLGIFAVFGMPNPARAGPYRSRCGSVERHVVVTHLNVDF